MSQSYFWNFFSLIRRNPAETEENKTQYPALVGAYFSKCERRRQKIFVLHTSPPFSNGCAPASRSAGQAGHEQRMGCDG